jgi:hypothetical protein
MSENKKKVPLTGKERAKIFYYKNLEKERLRKNNDYSRNKELLGLPPPKKQNKTTQPSTQTTQSSTQDTSSNQIPSSTQDTSSNQITSSSKSTASTQTPSSTKTYNTISTQTDFEPEPEPVIEDEPVVEQGKHEEISALDKVTSLINNIPNETKGNIKFRVDSFKTIIRILKTPTYKEFIKLITSNPKIVIKSIKEAEFRGKKYAIRSILAYFNCILFLLDKYEDIKITVAKKKLYKDQSSILSYIADDESDEKKQKLAETGGLPSYAEYTDKVVEKFGNEGREYLITELYKEIKARDDLILKVVRSKNDAVDDDNYLVINGGQQAEVIINSFKTKKKYGDFQVKLSPSLTSLIRKYLKNNKISYNDYLFNSKSLSVIVGRMNKALGVTGYGATNVFRKMLQTDLDQSGASPEQRLQLANELKHSMATAKKSYVIKKK